MDTRFETKEAADSNRNWFVVDANKQVVGRLATKIAAQLRGKNNPRFSPHTDCGDYVIVVNAEKIKFSGRKIEQKLYRHHTGYIGSLKSVRADKMLETKPSEIIKRAVSGMIPKSALGRRQLKKLKIYSGAEHPHQAQNPEPLN